MEVRLNKVWYAYSNQYYTIQSGFKPDDSLRWYKILVKMLIERLGCKFLYIHTHIHI